MVDRKIAQSRTLTEIPREITQRLIKDDTKVLLGFMSRHPTGAICKVFRKQFGIPIIIVAILVFGLPIQIRSEGAATSQSPLSLDGVASFGCTNLTSSCSATLTTSHTNDIIIVFTTEQLDLQSVCTFHVSDTAGLSWAARSNVSFDLSGRGQIQEFWARAVSPLGSDVVTESITGCGDNYNTILLFGIRGANFNSPFDPNVALPAAANGFGTTSSVQVSTSNSNDEIYADVVHGSHGSLTSGTGFTLITPAIPDTEATEYELVGSTLTNSSVTFEDTVSDGWNTIADAVQAGPTSPDFAIFANPSSLTVSSGGSSSTTIMVNSLDNFASPIGLTVSHPPVGFSAVIQPSEVTPPSNATATATLLVSSQVNQTSSFDLVINGTSGSLTHSVQVHVTFTILLPPDYNIAAPPSISVTAGGSTEQSVFVSSQNNFAGTVNLMAGLRPSLLAGPVLTLAPSTVTISPSFSGISTLTIFTSLNTTEGAYNYTIDGTAPFGGGFLHESFTGEIVVVPPPQPDFFLNAFPTALTVFAGSTASSTVQVSPAQPLSANLTIFLSATVPPVSGLTATLNPPTLTISPYTYATYSTLTISSLSTTPPGNYTVILAGQAGTIAHTVSITVQVRPPPTLTLTPTSGPTGTTVQAHGSGFPVQYAPSEILVTFDDQFMGFTFTSTGSFDFTFNVPLAQSGPHTVKASESLFFASNNSLITETAPFQVTGAPSGLSLSLTVGVVYFPGDKAVANVLVTSGGLPVSSSSLQLTITLTRPDNTKVALNVTRLGSGLFMATYSLPKTAPIGTYSLVAAAHLAGTGDSSNIASFEVKLPWLTSQQPAIAGTAGVAALALVGVALVSWRKGYFRKSSKESY